MKDRTYDRITNLLMLTAVASALVFDAGIFPRVVVGAVGGFVALVGAGLYFGSQRQNTTERNTNDGAVSVTAASVADSVAKPAEESAITILNPEEDRAEEEKGILSEWFLHERRIRFFGDRVYVLQHNHYSKYIVGGTADMLWGAVPQESSDRLTVDEVAECAVEIIHRLSGEGDGRWEFHVGPDGFRVSMRTRVHTPNVRIEPQRNFDFGQITTMIQ